MNCKKCGFVSNQGERFCRNCGSLLEGEGISNGVVQNGMVNGVAPNPMITNTNYNNAINPNMKKWAILSIVVPVIGIIWYWFIGLSFYLAILIASCGLAFAKKGELADKKLSAIGTIANGILIGMAIIMFILYCIGVLS